MKDEKPKDDLFCVNCGNIKSEFVCTDCQVENFNKLIAEFLKDLEDLEDSKWLRRHKEKWEERAKQ